MKKVICTIAIIFLINAASIGQIQLPRGFQCVLGQEHINESYFTNGELSFHSYPWGHDGIAGRDLIQLLERDYGYKIKFSRTRDGLYWGSGKVGSKYLYVVIAEESLQYTLKSGVNNSEFSNFSTWMLQQIRNNIASGLDNYFTDYYGKSCSGTNND